jgi:hypothetical protein
VPLSLAARQGMSLEICEVLLNIEGLVLTSGAKETTGVHGGFRASAQFVRLWKGLQSHLTAGTPAEDPLTVGPRAPGANSSLSHLIQRDSLIGAGTMGWTLRSWQRRQCMRMAHVQWLTSRR